MLGKWTKRLSLVLMRRALSRKASHPALRHLHLPLERHTEGEELWPMTEEDSPEGGLRTFSGRRRDYETESKLAAAMT